MTGWRPDDVTPHSHDDRDEAVPVYRWPAVYDAVAKAHSYEVPVSRDELPAFVHTALSRIFLLRVLDVDRDGATLPVAVFGHGLGEIQLRFETVSEGVTRIVARVHTPIGGPTATATEHNSLMDQFMTELRKAIAERDA